MNLTIENITEIFSYEFSKEINQIKIANSYNDKFFVCILLEKSPSCFINDNPYKI